MNVKQMLYKTLQCFKWYAQFFLCKLCRNFNTRVEELQADAFINPLILVPHSDDEWIGPFSILNKVGCKSTCVYFNLFGNNYSEANKQLRNSEIENSSQFWGFKLENNFSCDPESLVDKINGHTNIFVPSPYDWHPEHRMVFQTLYHALLLLPKTDFENKQIFYYSVSVPHRLCETVHYVPLNKVDVNAKWANFKKIYHSQSFMPAMRYKLNLRLVPAECGYAAQFYVKVDANRLKRDYEKSKDELFTTEADRLIYSINNIVKIRKQISRL